MTIIGLAMALPRSSAEDRDAPPRNASALDPAPLVLPPIHRYSFAADADAGKNVGKDGTEFVVDTIGQAHGVLRPRNGAASIENGQLVLADGGFVRLPPALLEAHDDVSFEFWFTPTAEEYAWHPVFEVGHGRDWFTYVFRTLEVHRAEVAVDGYNEDIQQNVPVHAGQAMHVVVAYASEGADGKPLLSYFRDGVCCGRMPTTITLADIDDKLARLGPIDGRFDEFRIYAHALSAAEVLGNDEAGSERLNIASENSIRSDLKTPCLETAVAPDWAAEDTPLRRAPIHRYSFDGRGGHGAFLTDSIGSAHGRVVAPRRDASLDGQGSLVIEDNGDGVGQFGGRLIAGRDEVSIEVWFTPTSTEYDWASLVRFCDTPRADRLWYAMRSADCHRAEIGTDIESTYFQRKRIRIRPGVAVHIVLAYDEDGGSEASPRMACYRNGVLAGELETNVLLSRLDIRRGEIGPIAGRFDELRVYDYPLSEAEVVQSFVSGPSVVRVEGRLGD